MTLRKASVLLYFFVHALTLGQACQYDEDCGDGKYCYEDSNLCTECENCTRYKRKEGKQLCSKNPGQCGDCLSGYYENENQVRHDGARPKFCSEIPTTTPNHYVELTTIPTNEEYPVILPVTNSNVQHPTAVPVGLILIIAGVVSIAAVSTAILNRKRFSNMIKSVSNSKYDAVNPDEENPEPFQPNNLETNHEVCSFPTVNLTDDVPQKAIPSDAPNWISPAQILDDDDAPEQPQQPMITSTDNPTIAEDTEAPPPYTSENSNTPQRQTSGNNHPTNESTNSQYQPNYSPEMDCIINNNNNLQSNQNVLFLNNIQMKFYLPNGYGSGSTGNSSNQFSSTTRVNADEIDTNALQIRDN